jgi:hypothetical protein
MTGEPRPTCPGCGATWFWEPTPALDGRETGICIHRSDCAQIGERTLLAAGGM